MNLLMGLVQSVLAVVLEVAEVAAGQMVCFHT
jgi:hypothetical protein